MDITLIHWTGSIKPAYVAARCCNSSEPPQEIFFQSKCLKEGDMAGFLKTKCLDHGHFSVIEHISFTFAISGVSRSFLAQLSRHRHISMSVQSQRYVNMEDFYYETPKSIQDNEEASDNYHGVMIALEHWYKDFLRLGISKEDARFIIPNAASTNLVMTANGRAIIEMSRKRLCNRSQWEIREVFTKIKKLVYGVCPLIAEYMGSPCTFGPCPEGDHECRGS